MEIYLVKYCPFIYESAYATLSIHRTLKGAYKAHKAFLESKYSEWYDYGKSYRISIKFMKGQESYIRKEMLQD